MRHEHSAGAYNWRGHLFTKDVLAAMLAYLVAINFDLPRPFWAVATIYVMANPLSGTRSFKPEPGYEASG